jgi:hypothetical protein
MYCYSLCRWFRKVKNFFNESYEIIRLFIFMHRAPVLVAISLIESGMDAGSAVGFIRNKRLVFYICMYNFQ